jgi:hypothetical protein
MYGMSSTTKALIGIAVSALLVVIAAFTFFIRPYPKPHIIDVTPSQSLVAVPLQGKTSDQAMAPTEEFYRRGLVYSKKYYVPQVWYKNGPFRNSGYFADGERVIQYERKPVVRVWTADPKTGTDPANQAIVAESRESIGFYTQMNCTVQMQDAQLPKFLANYNDKPLDQVMDNDVRAYVAGKFATECAKRTMDQILAQKGEIMSVVNSSTVEHFKNYGVTVSNLSIEGDFTYSNPAIQTAIDAVFKADREKKAQDLTNQKQLETAKKQVEAAKVLAKNPVSMKLKQIELENRRLDNEAAWIAAWATGKAPVPSTYVSGDKANMLFQTPAR